MLINQQSIDELIKVVDENNNNNGDKGRKTICISISPQAQASLAVRFGMHLERLAQQLCGFFRTRFGAAYVFDTAFAREFR